jgi:hypothetical protein
MRKLYFSSALLLALAAASQLFAQQPLLPNQFGIWHMTNCVEKPAHPILWQEAGERAFSWCQYSAGSQSVSIWTGRYRDPSSAYEIYTSGLRPNMQPSTLGKYTAVDRDKLRALVGDFVFEVQSPQNISTNDLLQFLTLLRAQADQTPLPPIRSYLPEQHLVSGTQRYALGAAGFRFALDALERTDYSPLANELGFRSGAEAMLAQYSTGTDSAVLLLVEYPTPQLAEQHLRHLEQAISSTANPTNASIERKGSLLSLVLGSSSAAYTRSLQKAVNYQTQVTWNEPTHTITDPPITSVLAKIIISTGVLMLVAVVLGVAFGGVRVLTKRLFPGKVFDRPERMEVLQLGLSGKRIDPSDFY